MRFLCFKQLKKIYKERYFMVSPRLCNRFDSANVAQEMNSANFISG